MWILNGYLLQGDPENVGTKGGEAALNLIVRRSRERKSFSSGFGCSTEADKYT